jgi:hypothetical protein
MPERRKKLKMHYVGYRYISTACTSLPIAKNDQPYYIIVMSQKEALFLLSNIVHDSDSSTKYTSSLDEV